MATPRAAKASLRDAAASKWQGWKAELYEQKAAISVRLVIEFERVLKRIVGKHREIQIIWRDVDEREGDPTFNLWAAAAGLTAVVEGLTFVPMLRDIDADDSEAMKRWKVDKEYEPEVFAVRLIKTCRWCRRDYLSFRIDNLAQLGEQLDESRWWNDEACGCKRQ